MERRRKAAHTLTRRASGSQPGFNPWLVEVEERRRLPEPVKVEDSEEDRKDEKRMVAMDGEAVAGASAVTARALECSRTQGDRPSLSQPRHNAPRKRDLRISHTS